MGPADEAAPGKTAILKTQAWETAQVKGLVSEFFQLVVLLVAPTHTGEAPKAFNLGVAGGGGGRGQGERPGWIWVGRSFTSLTENSAHLLV